MIYPIPPNPDLPDGIYVTVKQNGDAMGIRLDLPEDQILQRDN
jgi:hypothetical protein